MAFLCGMESERGEDFGDGGTDCEASVRTGLAMTLVFHGGAVCGGAHGPRPTRAFARIAGGQGRPPLRKRNKRCNGRATARVAPTKFLPIEIRRAGPACPAGSAEKESPSHGFAVPAPFRQGGHRDGGTDCHGQCSHWPRNDIGFSWGCGVRRGTWAPPYGCFFR